MRVCCPAAHFPTNCCLPSLAVTEAEDEERVHTVETAAETDDEDAEGIEMAVVATKKKASPDFDAEKTPGAPRYTALGDDAKSSHKGFDSELEAAHEGGEGLSGAQDAAIAGIVTIVGLVCTVLYWLITSGPASLSSSAAPALDGSSKGLAALRWRPTTHLQWWFAMLGGAMAFLHYFFLLKAFEGAPSTVLLPLVQVSDAA